MIRLLALLPLLLSPLPRAHADEGMWPFPQVPASAIEERHGFRPSLQWLERLHRSSLRLEHGCSASFVSPDGLVMTNHHCVLGCLKELSAAEGRNLVEQGFRARAREGELRCPGMVAEALDSAKDVSEDLARAPDPEAEKKRLAREAGAGEGRSHEFVSFHGGRQTWLYLYRKYDDLRLVMAPEESVAQFGGDQDNFDFPRHGLDMAFLRAYRGGDPARPVHHLSWSADGARKDELTFVSGNPGETRRFLSLAQAEFARDHQVPAIAAQLESRRGALLAASREAPGDPGLRVQTFMVENSLKAVRGWRAGLSDPGLLEKKRRQEAELRARLAADPRLGREYAPALAELEDVSRLKAGRHKEFSFRRVDDAFQDIAARLLGFPEKLKALPEARREAFRSAALAALDKQASAFLAAPALQEKLLAASLALSRKVLGEKDPFVRDALAGGNPEEAARKALTKTRMGDPEFRKSLLADEGDAVRSSKDPFLALARAAERHAAPLRRWYEKTIAPREAKAAGLLARAWHAAYGSSLYPDADFTPRLSFGRVRGYESFDGKARPHQSTFFGLFEKNESYGNEPPYALPERVRAGRGALDLSTPLNLVTDNDIIGGNSGSPLVNRAGEVVGLVFDGNLEGLGGRFAAGDNDRTIAVDSRAVLLALRSLYGMHALAEELTRGAAPRLLGLEPGV